MKSIQEYAIDLVADGAESTIEDDLNELGDIAEDDHQAACDLAMDVVRAIRDNPSVVLALVESAAPTPPQPTTEATPTT